MPTPKIIEIDEDQEVTLCPICSTPAIDEDGLVSQPSCPHISFVYANAEAFEYDPEGLETRLQALADKADEDGAYFDPWETLPTLCDKDDLILSQVSEGMACGAISFTVWIGIRREREGSRSRRLHLVAAADEEYSVRDRRVFFHPTPQFVRWMKAHNSGTHIYEVGCGTGNTASMLAKAGLHVTALDLEPRRDSEFDVIKADSTEYGFEEGSVLMFCRPCHDHDFVRNTILRGLCCGVRAVVYVGLQRNVRADLGGYYKKFTKRRVAGIGHADERMWEMKVSRLSANAHLRRGAIPPLSSDFSR